MNDNFEEKCHTSGPNRTQSGTNFQKLILLVRDTANSPFVNHKGKDVNSDWFADQWDERSVLGHAQVHKEG